MTVMKNPFTNPTTPTKNPAPIRNFGTGIDYSNYGELGYYGRGFTYNYDNDMEVFGRKAKYSGFWINRNKYSHATPDAEKVLKLAAIKRAITNFVRIMTKKTLNVIYRAGDMSATDGKNVILSAAADKNLDATVGLALHESAHIIKSNFAIRGQYKDLIPNSIFNKFMQKHKVDTSFATMLVTDIIANLHNIMEDRWIDNYIYTSAPGYKGYMREMYNMYFNSPEVGLALQSAEYREENWESYMFRIINIINENAQLDALKGLKEVYQIMDLDNIGVNINNTMDTFNVALQIFNAVEKYTDSLDNSNTPQNGNGGNNDDEEETDNTNESNESDGNGNGMGESDDTDDNDNKQKSKSKGKSKQSKQNKSNESEEDENGNDTDDADVSNNTNSKKTPTPSKLSQAQKNAIKNQIEKQKQFLNGETEKSSVTDTEQKSIKSMEESGTELVEVGDGDLGKTNVLIIKKMTKSIIESNMFDIFTEDEYRTKDNQEIIEKGIILGKMLGKKIQIRNDEKETKNTRLHSGRIDKRLLASIGYGNEAVFHTNHIDKYDNINLHISIDASGSMDGQKFRDTMTSVVAIAQAASMTKNISLKIDFRCTSIVGNAESPCLLIAYDSRIDKINKIANMFKYIIADGTTPEGLCFQSILNIITEDAKQKQAYFINFSDGEPYFNGNGYQYVGDAAVNHTRTQIEKMRKSGISILSYYIGRELKNDAFTKMYGKDAKFIQVTDLIPLAKTINDKFLEK